MAVLLPREVMMWLLIAGALSCAYIIFSARLRTPSTTLRSNQVGGVSDKFLVAVDEVVAELPNSTYFKDALLRMGPPDSANWGKHRPRIMHQTWKTRQLLSFQAKCARSWIKKNPDWKYSFTDDSANRAFMLKNFPSFIAMYDGYKSGIQRADAIRYFLLYKDGGLYSDLDFEALRPVQPFLESLGSGPVCILGQEPHEHSHILYGIKTMLCNALMISSGGGHPFWLAVFLELLHRRHIKTVRATGPKMLTAALKRYRSLRISNFFPVYVPPPEIFYPRFDDMNEELMATCERILEKRGVAFSSKHASDSPDTIRMRQCESLAQRHYMNNPNVVDRNTTIAVHHWMHLWLKSKEEMAWYKLDVRDIDTVISSAQKQLP